MNSSKNPQLRLIKIRMIMICLLVAVISVGAAFVPAKASAAASSGEQVLPLLINDSYVLFPGNLAPYQIEGRLMMPIRAFSDMIGAQLAYNSADKSFNFSFMGQTVNGIKAGQRNVVYDGVNEAPLDLKPEMKDGRLFVPIRSLLKTSRSIRWENMSNRVNKIHAVIRERQGLTLPQTPASQLLAPFVYTPETADGTFHPLFPVKLTQTAASGGGARLTLGMVNAAPFVVGKNNVELEMVTVDAMGRSEVHKLIGPSAQMPKGGASSVSFNVSSAADYVIFRSRNVGTE